MYYLNSRFYNPTIGRFINADGLLGSQGNILGHNMYAYTQNNPVMYVDPSGYLIDILKLLWNFYLDYKIYEIKYYQQLYEDSYEHVGTYSIGWYLNGSYLLSGTGNLLFSFDTYTNFAIQFVLSVGISIAIGTGYIASPTLAVGNNLMITNANNIYDLENQGWALGASFGVKSEGALGAQVGTELVFSEDYTGFNMYGGVGLITSSDIHGEYTYTWTLWSINISDKLVELYESLKWK